MSLSAVDDAATSQSGRWTTLWLSTIRPIWWLNRPLHYGVKTRRSPPRRWFFGGKMCTAVVDERHRYKRTEIKGRMEGDGGGGRRILSAIFLSNSTISSINWITSSQNVPCFSFKLSSPSFSVWFSVLFPRVESRPNRDSFGFIRSEAIDNA